MKIVLPFFENVNRVIEKLGIGIIKLNFKLVLKIGWMGILVNLAILNFKKIIIIIWPIFGHPVPIRNIYRGGGQHSNLNQSNK